jgi:hypothetical protein
MGQKIPPQLKIKVLREWLRGISRDAIASNNQIGYGSVSKIIEAIKDKEILDIDLLREVALALKKKNLDVVGFAGSMRLKNMLDNLGLSEEHIEKLLEHLSVLIYKRDDKNVEKFLIQLELVYEMAINLEVSIFAMPKKIEEMTAKIAKLEHKESIVGQRLDQKRKEITLINKQLTDMGYVLWSTSQGLDSWRTFTNKNPN